MAGGLDQAAAAVEGLPVEPCNVADYERIARERLEPGAYGYFAGGAGDERTLDDNVAAYRRWQLRPRALVDVSAATTAATVLGAEVSMPLVVAPVAFQRMAHPDGEPGMARAAAAAGTVMVLSTLATATPAEIAAAAPGARRWFQLYIFRDRGVTRALIEQAEEAGFEAIALTVDVPRLGRRERDLRTGFVIPAEVTVPSFAAAAGKPTGGTPADMFSLMDPAVTWDDLEELVSDCNLPVLVKGILTAEDAALAVDHGAAGVVVSNHGGRQLDGATATIDALPEVADAVEGRIEVLVDGGIRRGADVVKALALGARAVLAGRAPLWGLAARGEQGAREVLELLREEIELAMVLTGAAAPDALNRTHVRAAPPGR
ncbi:MAG TPA: alpha-hydroxy acid oxidase [Solirubrobacterales bacterium]|nr:alpha-hydroxy acid oxidase [Solirubrobacterales bacterium]